MKSNRGLGTLGAMELDETGDIEVGQDVAVNHNEGFIDTGVKGGESNGPGGVEWFRLDGVRHMDTGHDIVGVGRDESIREITQRQHCLGNAMVGQIGQDALQHRHPHDGQHLLGCAIRQRPKARALSPNQNDGAHGDG